MEDKFYPKVSLEFIIGQLELCGKIMPDSTIRVGNTTAMVILGSKALHKRMIIIRDFNGEVNFEQASGLAIKFSFIGSLLEWFEREKNWKEGGYIVPKEIVN